MKIKLFALSGVLMASVLSGCALAPQVISLDQTPNAKVSAITSGRTALIRVTDTREDGRLGYRGGWSNEDSPLIAEPNLAGILTPRLHETFSQLGFGGASQELPVKFELKVDKFKYQCNEGLWVSHCELEIKFIAELGNGFSKAFALNQNRSVVAAPRAKYNEEWINGALDELWGHMFSNEELLQAISKN